MLGDNLANLKILLKRMEGFGSPGSPLNSIISGDFSLEDVTGDLAGLGDSFLDLMQDDDLVLQQQQDDVVWQPQNDSPDGRMKWFDHTQDLPFFMRPEASRSVYALGGVFHEMIQKGERGCVLWAWREDFENCMKHRLSGFICSQLTHTTSTGRASTKAGNVNCCVFVNNHWTTSSVRLAYRDLLCCGKGRYSFRVLDKKTFGNWIQVAVFKAEMSMLLETPDHSLASSLTSPPKRPQSMDSIDVGAVCMALNDSFILGGKIFGLKLHKYLMGNGKVTVYAEQEFNGLLGNEGVFCSEIVHQRNVSNCKIVFEKAGSLRVASVYASQTATCCNKALYLYRVSKMR